jgi:hypothetical protein
VGGRLIAGGGGGSIREDEWGIGENLSSRWEKKKRTGTT